MAKEIALVGRHRLYVNADPTTTAASIDTEVSGLRTINPSSISNMVNTRHAGANSEYQRMLNLARGINIACTVQVEYEASATDTDQLDEGLEIIRLASFGIRSEEVTADTDPSNVIAVKLDAPGGMASITGPFSVSGYQHALGGGGVEAEATASFTLHSFGVYTVTLP